MAENKWVSVDDRLPGLDETVLVFRHGRDTEPYLARRCCNRWEAVSDDCEVLFGVTHWAPVPEFVP